MKWYKNMNVSLHKNERKQLYLAAASSLILMSVLFSMVYIRKSEETLSSHIAPQVLRFHVLANSDSPADQSLKLEVKQFLLQTIYEDLPDKTSPLSKESLISYLSEHKDELEDKAETFMASKGVPYSAEIRLEQCYFPTKIYGDVIFPCGTYDAVRVLIGKGSGKNWWCVLYPPLCFTENSYGVVPDSSKKELENLLTEEDFQDLMKHRRVVFDPISQSSDKPIFVHETKSSVPAEKPTVHVRLRFVDLIRGYSSR